MVKTIYLLLFLFCPFMATFAQSYRLIDLEAQFLRENYLLLAERYELSKAEATLIQEKLLPNPSLQISEVNLWSNATAELMPKLIGNYGQKQQFAVELEQLIETAGKRKKRVAIRQLEQQTALFVYEGLLRALKKDLRHTFNELEIKVLMKSRLVNSILLFESLYERYARLVQQRLISQSEFYRVQAALLSFRKEQLELANETAVLLQRLRVLTNLPTLELSQLHFAKAEFNLSAKIPVDIRTVGIDRHIGLQQQRNKQDISRAQLRLERAMRKPDLAMHVSYDRGSGTMLNFVGFGMRMDLPIFNRNKGAIQFAQYQIEQEDISYQAMVFEMDTELSRLQKQLIDYERELAAPWAEATLADDMLERYEKNLLSKKVTLLEFIDYAESSKAAYEAQLELQQGYKDVFEEIQYLLGQDF